METVTRRTWLEVENEKTSQSVCGLEISFQAPPQVTICNIQQTTNPLIARPLSRIPVYGSCACLRTNASPLLFLLMSRPLHSIRFHF